MYKPVLIIALLVAAVTFGHPTTGVDSHDAARSLKTTGIEGNDALQDPAQGSDLAPINPMELQEELTRGTPKAKRDLCRGLISVCSEDSEGDKEVAGKILQSQERNMKTIIDGLIRMALARAVQEGMVTLSETEYQLQPAGIERR